MPKSVWIYASILSVLVIMGFMGLSNYEKGRDLAKTLRDLELVRSNVESNQAQIAKLNEDLNATQSRMTELQQEKEKVTKAQHSLEQEMRSALQSKDITISELKGKLTVNILDRILFDSGEATLKPEGTNVLQKIAQVLSQYPTRQVHVIGHTDNVPIKSSARHRFPSNWELSTARATAAVRYLTEEAGVDPRRLGAVGYGEYHPVADNASIEGRAQNRRIALVILSEELAGSDASPNAVPPAKTEPLQLFKPVTNVVSTTEKVKLATNVISPAEIVQPATNKVSTAESNQTPATIPLPEKRVPEKSPDQTNIIPELPDK